ncbi:MAG: bifunctional precorrin-2 dehydrogenase/sirohydrochlorin ferrochelatase [Tissierellia bacterium]|nr:bifunctional precorrin-2 dehydrogenase/sirohydrochlorin ferrochelatase [Tissierellia bacterium]
MRYPMMVDLSEKIVKIIGGGEVARRKGLALRDYCNHLYVIGPEIHRDLEFANCIYSDEPEKYLEDADFVIICTNNESVNKKLAAACKDKNIWYLLGSDEKNSEVIFPAVLDMGDLQFCITTNGAYPALARKIKEELIEKYDKYDREFIEELKKFRKIVIDNNLDRQLLYDVLDLNLEELKEYIGRYK